MTRTPKIDRNSRYRAMALLLQTAMQRKNLDVRGLTDAMGLEARQHAAVYNWVCGKNGPSPPMRKELLHALDLDEAAFVAALPEKLLPGRSSTQEPAWGPAQRAVAMVRDTTRNGEAQVLPPAPPASDVFSFKARSDGSVTVRLDVALPYARGTQLVQFLLGFGLVIGADDDATEG